MTRQGVSARYAALIVGLCPLAAEAQTVDEIIAKNLAARGGKDRIAAIKTVEIKGTIAFGDVEGPIWIRIRRENQIRQDFMLDHQPGTRAYDGKMGWEWMSFQAQEGPHPLADGDLENIREEAENAIDGPLLNAAARGNKVEYLGKVAVGGRTGHKLRITMKSGRVIEQYLDPATYLAFYEEIERNVGNHEALIVGTIGDYEETKGVQFARKFVNGPREKPEAQKLTITSVDVDATFADDIFEMPVPKKEKP